MTAAKRRTEIQSLLIGKTQMDIHELSKHFGVSVVTIRKDLRILEQQGLIARSRGGAAVMEGQRYNLQQEMRIQGDYKQRIAAHAAGMVEDREVILLGPGSTCCMLGQLLCKRENLLLVTNAICFEPYLSFSSARLMYLGGDYNPANGYTTGGFAIDALQTMQIDRLFLGASGVSGAGGITSYNFADTLMVRTMIERSKQVIIVADHTKFGQVSAIRIAELSAVDQIITNVGADPKHVREIEESGVVVTQV